MDAAASAERLTAEKHAQAVEILREVDVDLWMLVGRETGDLEDPSLPLVLGTTITWESAFLLSRDGSRLAIVGTGDVENIRQAGGWEVEGYVRSLREPLRAALDRLRPGSIALNFSPDNHMADGLTHGMYLLLERYLAGTPHWGRIVSGEAIASRLRGRKSPAEVALLRRACAATEEIFAEVASQVRAGVTEREVAVLFGRAMASRGVRPAWDPDYCPTVRCGPGSPVGHVAPGDERLRPGTLLNVDLGIILDGYCSDLQRTWYAPEGRGDRAPHDVRDAFDLVLRAIDAGAVALRPGVPGYEVDAAARAVFEADGKTWDYGFGHQLGRAVHDGGGVLGPRWERYGRRPFELIEAGQVYTLEIGVSLPGRGFVSVEEDALVTPGGVEWLSTPQREVMVL